MFKRRIWFVFVLSCFLGACSGKNLTPVTLYYTADVQGVYWPRPEPRFENREVGGYAVLKSFLDKQTEKGEEFLLLDGGNWFGGTPEGMLSKGEYMPAIVQPLPYALAAVSDKELVYGWPSLRAIIQKNNFPVVASNLRLEGKMPWPLHDYQIKTVDGVKIGFFAVLDDKKINAATRLTGMRALDALQTARDMAALLREKGVDAVVLFSSLGTGDKDGLTDAVLAEETQGIDLILSSNLDREDPETDKINNTHIIYPGSKLDSVAKIRLLFDKHKQLTDVAFEDVVLEKDVYGEDEPVATAVNTLRADTKRKMDARVTSSAKNITGDLNGESVLGDLLADCLHKWAKLDGVVLNSDSLREPLPSGKITEYDVYKMYPYSDNITFVTIRGEALQKALEASLAVKDNFPQIAGMSVEYNPQAEPGKKIKRIYFSGGRALRPQDTYRVAVTDHVMAGGFGHDEFINALEFKNTFVEARQIMRTCLIRQKEIAAPEPGRWKKTK